MKIPSKIKIGTQTIKVTLTPAVNIDSDCNGGWAKWEQNHLLLASDMPQERIEQVFLHEVFHFINVYLTEEQCTYLAEGMYGFLKDNKINFNE